MAITIHQQPYKYTALKQKLIVVATSSNIGQPGFRYVVEVTVNGGAANTFTCSLTSMAHLYLTLIL